MKNMKTFEEKQFNIGELKGISKTNIDEHLKLYSGYVKNANSIREKLDEMYDKNDSDLYHRSELHRRFSFEYNGMRNHEVFFASLEDGAVAPNVESTLYKKISEQWGDFDKWLEAFKQMAKTRGIGWANLSYDSHSEELLINWIDEQHLGQLNTTTPILMLDMWEHSFVADYQPSGKGQYIDDFFENLNWSVIENNYDKAVK
jgi:Fe-Mn family superoxide dismutase